MKTRDATTSSDDSASRNLGPPEEWSDEGSWPPSDGRFSIPPFLTTHCARCDYSLEGLPRDARCPECGTQNDDRFIVLRGRTNGRTDYGNRSAWPSFMYPVWMFTGMAFEEPLAKMIGAKAAGQLPYLIALSCLVMVLAVYAWRWWNLDGPPHQLWLSPGGYWIHSRVPLLQSETATTIGWATLVVFIVAMFVRATMYSVITGGGVLLLVAIITATWLAVRRSILKDSVLEDVPGHGRVRFMSWRTIESSTLHSADGDRCKLTLRPYPPTFFATHRAASDVFRFKCSLEFARYLESRVWSLLHAARAQSIGEKRT